MKSKNFLAVAALVAVAALTGCTAQASALTEPASEVTSGPEDNCTGGFETIWNSTPGSGDVSKLPQETVTVVSETGQIFDAMRRTANGTAEAVAPADIDYKVNVDPTWPKNHAVVIDTDTDKVLETIEIPDDAPICEWSTETATE